MKASTIVSSKDNKLLKEGFVYLAKGRHGWKLVIEGKDNIFWRKSAYIEYLYPMTRKEDEVTLVVFTADDNWYFFDCEEGTAKEAIKKFNKTIGLTW